VEHEKRNAAFLCCKVQFKMLTTQQSWSVSPVELMANNSFWQVRRHLKIATWSHSWWNTA